MDKEIKAKWVEALRSGNYKQGTNYLNNRDENTFCCLGVLCEINSYKGIQKSPIMINNGDKPALATSFRVSDDDEKESSIFYLTKKARDYFGLDKDQCQSLMDMNDGVQTVCEVIEPKSFSEIALYIEENL